MSLRTVLSGVVPAVAGPSAPPTPAPDFDPSMLVPTIDLRSVPSGPDPVRPRMATPREYLDTADGQTALESLYRASTPGFDLMQDRSERILALDHEGKGGAITYSLPGDARSVQAAIPNNAQAVVHSHPMSASPWPSPADYAVATRLNKPNFILSRGALYVAMPGTDQNTDKHTKVADVTTGKGGKLNIKWVGKN